jgi:hypothetical protein
MSMMEHNKGMRDDVINFKSIVSVEVRHRELKGSTFRKKPEDPPGWMEFV